MSASVRVPAGAPYVGLPIHTGANREGIALKRPHYLGVSERGQKS